MRIPARDAGMLPRRRAEVLLLALALAQHCARRAASQATPSPTAALPVDSSADFSCQTLVKCKLHAL